MQREVAKAEADVQLVRDRAARDQARLDAGTGTAKDLQAIQHELVSLARRQAELEDIELEVMERAEAAESDVAELERGRGELTARIEALEAARDEAFARLDGEAAEIGAPRDDASSPRSGADLVALYEKIRISQRRHRGGRAAPAPVRRAASSSSTRSRSSASAPRPSDEVLRCEECRRILVRTRRVGPVSRRLTVEADGGSRGNPGVAGYGALVRDTDTGALLAERAEPLGKASNNVAEYRGLIAGLEAAAAIDPRRRGRRAAGLQARRRADVRTLEDQARGHAPPRAAGPRPRRRASPAPVGRCASSGSRASENKDADALSNVAMDGRSVDRRLERARRRCECAPVAPAGRARRCGSSSSPRRPARRPARQRAPSHTCSAPRRGASSPRRSEDAVETAAEVGAALGADSLVDPVWDGAGPDLGAAWERVVDRGGTTVVVCATASRSSSVLGARARACRTTGARASPWRPGRLTGVEVWGDDDVSVAFTNRT